MRTYESVMEAYNDNSLPTVAKTKGIVAHTDAGLDYNAKKMTISKADYRVIMMNWTISENYPEDPGLSTEKLLVI